MRLSARDVLVVRQGRALLDRVTLELAPGEVVAVVGPNGAGKSTLCAVLSGELASARPGGVWLDGRRLDTWSAAELAARRAVVRQHSVLAADFTADEVVALGCDASRRDRRHACLAEVGLAGFHDRRYLSLSGGERARVHLARALHQLGDRDDAVLLLDEPTAALDAREQHRALSIARARARRGWTVLVIVHDLVLAAHYADRVAVLTRGAIAICDTPTRALAPEPLHRAFGVRFELVATSAGLVPLPVLSPAATPPPCAAPSPCPSPRYATTPAGSPCLRDRGAADA